MDCRCEDPLAGESDQLLQKRLPVPHRTVGPPCEQLNRVVINVGPFSLRDLTEPRHNRFRFDAGKVKPLAAREHGDGDFVRFGRTENKLDVLWGLFECFEQRVEGIAREHVDFIDDVNFES